MDIKTDKPPFGAWELVSAKEYFSMRYGLNPNDFAQYQYPVLVVYFETGFFIYGLDTIREIMQGIIKVKEQNDSSKG